MSLALLARAHKLACAYMYMALPAAITNVNDDGSNTDAFHYAVCRADRLAKHYNHKHYALTVKE